MIARLVTCLTLFVLLTPAPCLAVGLEAAVSGWRQAPSGELAYEPLTEADLLDLEDDFDYQEEYQLTGRLKLDLPLPLPNVALMYTPMRFEGTGSTDFAFNFGDQSFSADQEFSSEVQLDHYDVGLYYGLPLLDTATLERLSVELGINARIFDVSAEVEQAAVGIRETVSETQPFPLIYAAVLLQPLENWHLELEARGIAYEGNSMLSLVGRFRYGFFDPFFTAAGYRYEDVDVDEDDIEADVTVQGPFVELGLEL